MSAIAVATTTRYATATDPRCKMAQLLLEACNCRGYPVVVVDGSPSIVVRKLLEEAAGELGSFIDDQDDWTMGMGRRRALRRAADFVENDGAVVWIEPEKYDLIRFLDGVQCPIFEERATVVIPYRTADSWRTYPSLQEPAEKLGNAIFRELTRQDLDVWFGPRAIRRGALYHFLSYDGSYGDKWDSIFIPLLRIIAAGGYVASVPVEYRHPAEQLLFESNWEVAIDKRLGQLSNLGPALRQEAQKLGLV